MQVRETEKKTRVSVISSDLSSIAVTMTVSLLNLELTFPQGPLIMKLFETVRRRSSEELSSMVVNGRKILLLNYIRLSGFYFSENSIRSLSAPQDARRKTLEILRSYDKFR